MADETLHITGQVNRHIGTAGILNVSTSRRWFSSSIQVKLVDGPVVDLAGLNRRTAADLCEELLANRRRAVHHAQLFEELCRVGPAISAWWRRVTELMMTPRWIAASLVADLERARPHSLWSGQLAEAWTIPALASRMAQLPAWLRTAVEGWSNASLGPWARTHNAEELAYEKAALANWFATIEKSPLTEEQVDAVVTFDDRVRVIAAAGSGKTSTMVAKAAYTVHRGLADPEQILMLAFNARAAAELTKRTLPRLPPGATPVKASTFHAFGLRVIGEATGSKPRVPDDLAGGDGGVTRLSRIVDELREEPGFRRDWDLFRLVLGHPTTAVDADPDTCDADIVTLNGEKVRSREEQMIANWLFYNGVSYRYEQPYVHDVSDAHHSQYRPDFYYPDIDTWHEHWALNADGEPPPHFAGYADKVAWGRRTHVEHGTDLIETTSASIRDGSGFDHLAAELTQRGITLDENPYREIPGQAPLPDRDLFTLIRTFMSHLKSNRRSVAELQPTTKGDLRARLFLRLAEPIVNAWDAKLRGAGEVDFDDMINHATNLVRAGAWHSPYRLIMVDEMQDTSTARAALIRALLDQDPHHHLYAVGDDWQAINRFAGSDLSTMTHFEDWFGPTTTCYLTHTFRCPQSLCDIAGTFVLANPDQIPKHVISHQPEPGTASVTAVALPPKVNPADHIRDHLEQLDENATTAAEVLILGRYKRVRAQLEPILDRRWTHLKVRFSTIHAAKGSEADHIVIVGLTTHSIPCTITDDPLLHLAMAAGDSYPDAEERRLFYVALTRARHTALLLTTTGQESSFLLELARASDICFTRPGQDSPVTICPGCRRATQVSRQSRYGWFWGCSRYPTCTHTTRLTQRQR